MNRLVTYIWQHGMIALLCISMLAMSACSTDQVLADLSIVLQASESLEVAIGNISQSDAKAIEVLTGIAVAGLNAIQIDYNAYEVSKSGTDLQKLLEAATVLQDNLLVNLAAAHISDASAVAKTTAWVDLVVTTLKAVVAIVSPPVAGRRGVRTIPAPESLKARWLHEVCNDNVQCGNLVKVHHKSR